jgi:hypothetical protein
MAQFSWMQGHNSHISGSLEEQAALAALAGTAQLQATFNCLSKLYDEVFRL